MKAPPLHVLLENSTVVFASCDGTSGFQEILLGSVALLLGQLSVVANCALPADS